MTMSGKTDMSIADDDRIVQAIAAAETRTQAEIVVAILQRASAYRLTAVLCTFAVAALGALLLALLMPGLVVLYAIGTLAAGIIGIVVIALLGIVTYLLCERTKLGVFLTPAVSRQQACAKQARLMFLEHGVDATADRLGLLVFVSLADRHVEILPDRGIVAKIPPERWSALIAGFIKRIGDGDLDASLSGLIVEMADELAPHFPPSPDQTDDLRNTPIRG
jgi:putative membrane protein